jgi:hypothetical protein
MASHAGVEFELLLAEKLKAAGLDFFWTEDDLRTQGYYKTPDVRLQVSSCDRVFSAADCETVSWMAIVNRRDQGCDWICSVPDCETVSWMAIVSRRDQGCDWICSVADCETVSWMAIVNRRDQGCDWICSVASCKPVSWIAIALPHSEHGFFLWPCKYLHQKRKRTNKAAIGD